MQDAAYHIAKSYKVWSPGVPADAPFGGQQHSYQKAGNRFNQFSQYVTRRLDEGASLDLAKEDAIGTDWIVIDYNDKRAGRLALLERLVQEIKNGQ